MTEHVDNSVQFSSVAVMRSGLKV